MKKSALIFIIMSSTGALPLHMYETEVVLCAQTITQEQIVSLRSELNSQLAALQRGLQAWYYTTPVFNQMAKSIYGCSDRDIAIFPFAQGLWYTTADEMWDFVCVERLNKRWQAICNLVKDVHDVRYELHLITCSELSLTNTLCGKTAYKSIEDLIKNDKAYEKRYKQYVLDGMIISYLYESGIVR